VVTADVTVCLPLAGLVDLAAERERLQKEMAEAQQQLNGSERLLSSANFTGRAPAEVVERERSKADDLRHRLGQLQRRLAQLSD
jgi:valyl-tRNA synthetase